MTRFQIYHETEFAGKYSNPLYKTQYSKILVEYEKKLDKTTGKIKFDPYATSHPITEGTLYVPVNFYKSTVTLVEQSPWHSHPNHTIVKAHVYKNYH